MSTLGKSTNQMFWNEPIARHLKRLQETAKERGIPDDIQKLIETCMDCVCAKEDYCDDITTPPSEAVDNLIKETESHPWQQVFEEGKVDYKVRSRMLSGKFEGAFLKTLVSMSNAKKVLEIGLFTGCGALSMAEALPADGTVVTCEIADYLGELAKKLMGKSPHGKKVSVMVGPASDSLTQLAKEGQKFDLVFIDADKEGYIDYYKIIMDNNMLTPRGTILIDNALHAGQPYLAPENVLLADQKPNDTMKRFNDFVFNDDRVSQVMVPLRDGVMIIRRKEAFEGEA